MRRIVALVCALAALGAGGCGMSADAGAGATFGAGQCSRDSDCSTGRCSNQMCVSRSSALEKVALEVVAPSAISVGEYRQMRYLKAIELLSAPQVDLNLDYVVDLTVAAKPPLGTCLGLELDSEGRVPVRVEVIQDPRVSGLASSSYFAESDPTLSDFSAALKVPPGTADLYLVPDFAGSSAATDLADCAMAPVLALGQTLQPGSVNLEQTLSLAKQLSVTVTVALDSRGNSPLDGFTCDIIDPLLGRRISTQVKLASPVIEGKAASYAFSVAYQPVVGEGAAELAGLELIRFSPAEPASAPTYYVARLAADLLGTGSLTINHISSVPPQVTVTGHIKSDVDGAAVPSVVTAILRNVADAKTGALLQFRASTTTDDSGSFELPLVAGEYDVMASPRESTSYGSVFRTWSVGATPSKQSGYDVRLPGSATLTGLVVDDTSGLAELQGNVLAIPTTVGRSRSFIDALVDNGGKFDRRSSTAALESDGRFALPIDLGNYDIYVRPTGGGEFPWAVRPNTAVETAATALPAIQVASPFSFSGLVTVPGTTQGGGPVVLPGALIRAFALYGSDGRLVGNLLDATSAVPIGEARATSEGAYHLLLPATLE